MTKLKHENFTQLNSRIINTQNDIKIFFLLRLVVPKPLCPIRVKTGLLQLSPLRDFRPRKSYR